MQASFTPLILHDWEIIMFNGATYFHKPHKQIAACIHNSNAFTSTRKLKKIKLKKKTKKNKNIKDHLDIPLN